MPAYIRALTLVPILIVVAFLVVLGDKVGWGLSAAVFGVIVVWALAVVLVLRRRTRTASAEAAICALGKAQSGGWIPRRPR
jgi:membrane associated rhomboid family serine protease